MRHPLYRWNDANRGAAIPATDHAEDDTELDRLAQLLHRGMGVSGDRMTAGLPFAIVVAAGGQYEIELILVVLVEASFRDAGGGNLVQGYFLDPCSAKT